MKMKHVPLIALGIAMVILVSGCVNQPKVTVSTSDGLAIVEYDPEAELFANDEPIPLYMKIENQGGTTATNVVAEIVGASWTSKPTQTYVSMSPPDLTIRPAVPGQFEIFAPVLDKYSKLPEGVEAKVTLTGRVSYDYASNGMVTIHVLNKDEYRRRMQMQRSVPGSSEVYNSYGPIHIDIDDRGLSPVVAQSNENDPEQVSLTIYIKNVGSGAPITGNEVGQMNVNLELQGAGARFDECNGRTDVISGANREIASLPIVLRRGEKYTIPCKVTVTTPLIEDAFSVLFNTRYRYFIEQPRTITVVGAPQS